MGWKAQQQFQSVIKTEEPHAPDFYGEACLRSARRVVPLTKISKSHSRLWLTAFGGFLLIGLGMMVLIQFQSKRSSTVSEATNVLPTQPQRSDESSSSEIASATEPSDDASDLAKDSLPELPLQDTDEPVLDSSSETASDLGVEPARTNPSSKFQSRGYSKHRQVQTNTAKPASDNRLNSNLNIREAGTTVVKRQPANPDRRFAINSGASSPKVSQNQQISAPPRAVTVRPPVIPVGGEPYPASQEERVRVSAGGSTGKVVVESTETKVNSEMPPEFRPDPIRLRRVVHRQPELNRTNSRDGVLRIQEIFEGSPKP
jgi:hypothetical protein